MASASSSTSAIDTLYAISQQQYNVEKGMVPDAVRLKGVDANGSLMRTRCMLYARVPNLLKMPSLCGRKQLNANADELTKAISFCIANVVSEPNMEAQELQARVNEELPFMLAAMTARLDKESRRQCEEIYRQFTKQDLASVKLSPQGTLDIVECTGITTQGLATLKKILRQNNADVLSTMQDYRDAKASHTPSMMIGTYVNAAGKTVRYMYIPHLKQYVVNHFKKLAESGKLFKLYKNDGLAMAINIDEGRSVTKLSLSVLNQEFPNSKHNQILAAVVFDKESHENLLRTMFTLGGPFDNLAALREESIKMKISVFPHRPLQEAHFKETNKTFEKLLENLTTIRDNISTDTELSFKPEDVKLLFDEYVSLVNELDKAEREAVDQMANKRRKTCNGDFSQQNEVCNKSCVNCQESGGQCYKFDVWPTEEMIFNGVQFFHVGDLKCLCTMCGIRGGSANFACVDCIVSKMQISSFKKAGVPHTQLAYARRNCIQDYKNFLSDGKEAKNHGQFRCPLLIDSLNDEISPTMLHAFLGIFNKIMASLRKDAQANDKKQSNGNNDVAPAIQLDQVDDDDYMLNMKALILDAEQLNATMEAIEEELRNIEDLLKTVNAALKAMKSNPLVKESKAPSVSAFFDRDVPNDYSDEKKQRYNELNEDWNNAKAEQKNLNVQRKAIMSRKNRTNKEIKSNKEEMKKQKGPRRLCLDEATVVMGAKQDTYWGGTYNGPAVRKAIEPMSVMLLAAVYLLTVNDERLDAAAVPKMSATLKMMEIFSRLYKLTTPALSICRHNIFRIEHYVNLLEEQWRTNVAMTDLSYEWKPHRLFCHLVPFAKKHWHTNIASDQGGEVNHANFAGQLSKRKNMPEAKQQEAAFKAVNRKSSVKASSSQPAMAHTKRK